jgi:uncharacterized phage-like protein YoqJ
MFLALTGHRPEDAGDEGAVRRLLRQGIEDSGADTVITGMAAGVDIWGGLEALYLGLDVIAARPWTTHRARKQDEEAYLYILASASDVIDVVESKEYPGPWCYHKRNEWMVDHADRVLAYWSGKESGGTYACIKYARKQLVPIRNVYP